MDVDAPVNRAFFMSNVLGSEDDISHLSSLFETLGYQCSILGSGDSDPSYFEQMERNHVPGNGAIVVFFFGFGFQDFLLLDKKGACKMHYRDFCREVNRILRIENFQNHTVVFSNIYVIAKTGEEVTVRDPKTVTETFYFTVKTPDEGNQDGGRSLLTKYLCEEIQRERNQNICELVRNVSVKMKSEAKEKQQLYALWMHYLNVSNLEISL